MDLRKNQSTEPVKEKDDLTAQVLHWARDRTGALEGSGAASEVKPPQETAQETAEETARERSQETKTEASPRVIVVALNEGADDSGAAHLFDDFQAAGRFVETLLEEGLDQERVSVFNCAQMNVHLTYRAVVHLKTSEAEEEPDA